MKGFTLIEVVVSISISLIVTGLIIANYNSYNDIQTLKQAALTLKNNLRFIQSKAGSGEKPVSGCTELLGWTITFIDASSYKYQPSCSDGLVDPVTTVDLPPSVKFTTPIPPSFTMNVLTRGTSLSSDTPILLTAVGKTYQLFISTSGDISDKGLQ
jgi:prepilin-type N-terminal cleavage/methylation domain-containing protein